jgi:hypothetical protein
MPSPAPPPGRTSAACGVGSHALVEARQSQIAALRDQPGPAAAPTLPARFLRHCDEQTVVGMQAMLAAIAALPEPRPALDSHAVVAAPRHAGRLVTARALVALRDGGPVTVSPHIVPQCSLHSVAGAVSVALGMHGPHLGVGGGVDALAEGLCAALTLAGDPATGTPLVWLVATEWDEEPVLDPAGDVVGDPVCRGLAVAIESAGGCRAAPDRPGPPLELSIHAASGAAGGQPAEIARPVAAFADALDMCRAGAALVSWSLACPWGGEIRVQYRPTVAGGRRQREAA